MSAHVIKKSILSSKEIIAQGSQVDLMALLVDHCDVVEVGSGPHVGDDLVVRHQDMEFDLLVENTSGYNPSQFAVDHQSEWKGGHQKLADIADNKRLILSLESLIIL